MPRFEFVVEGPPVSVNAKDKQAKKYQKWIMTVRRAAEQEWPPDGIASGPLSPPQEVTVEITNYYAEANPDVDNVIKPILDGMGKRDNVKGVFYKGVVYEDDKQVYKVISTRVKVADIDLPTPRTAQAVQNYAEFLLISVLWQTED